MCTRSRPRTAPGFTLVELVVVLSIMGILAAIAVPRYAGFVTGQRADAAARRITTDLAWAQQRARVTSQRLTISFNVGSDEYRFPDPDDPENDYVVNLTKAPYQAVIVSANFEGDADLPITGYGVAERSGTIVIQVGSYQRTITVDPGQSVPGGGQVQKGKVAQ